MKKPSELSIEELIRSKTRLKGILIGYMIIVALLFLIYIYLRFFGSTSITVVPFIILPVMVVPIAISLKNITDEIKLRQSHKK